jgi:hypothetical protein
MIIRLATIADLPRLIGLFQSGIAHQRQITPFFDLAPQVDWQGYTRAKLQNPSERVLVAEQDEQLLGYINVRVPHPPPHRSLTQIINRLLGRTTTLSIVRPRRVG